MITGTICRDHCFVLKLSAFRSCCELAVCYGIACCLEESKCCCLSCCVLVICAHVRSVKGIAVFINGECYLITVIGRLRSSPGCIGNRIVDYGSSVTVVGIDSYITVYREDCRECAAEVLGSVRTGIAAYTNVVCIDTDITVSKVINRVGHDLAAAQLAAVLTLDILSSFLLEGRIGYVIGTGYNAVQLISIGTFLEVDELGLRSALEVVLVSLKVNNTVLKLHELVRTCAERLCGLCTNRA